MLKKIEYGYGILKALVILGIVPVAIYSHGFSPSLEMEFNHVELDRQIEEWKKEKGISDKDCSQDYSNGNSSDSSGPSQPNEPDSSGNSPW